MKLSTHSFSLGRHYRRLLSLFMAGACVVTAHADQSVGRLLFDDYYQKPRSAELYDQGVARGGMELRNLTNFYAADATAIPNGTFVFFELIADKFQVEVSREPISEELLQGVAAYMMVCPFREEMGGRANLTEREASILDSFVARGGILILAANSNPDPEKSGFDFPGLNLIAGRFGVEFQAAQTDTISIPIAVDSPWFDGVRDIIFGNGTTLKILDSAEPGTQVLLESHSKRALGPVAVIATHHKGKVLLFGDAGTFGNAHAFRSDLDHAKALRQMMLGLLPDGPVPHYGWKEGMKLRVKLKQEKIVSAYPEFMQMFKLPRPEGTKIYTSGMRQIDIAASEGGADSFGSRDFVSAVSTREAVFDLEIRQSEGQGYHAVWSDETGELPATLLPKGRFISPGVPESEALTDWQAILLNEAIVAPLKAFARPGEQWTAASLASLPHAQLSMSSRLVQARSDYTFEGESDYEGQPCYLIKQVTRLEGENWQPSDIVGPEYAMQFNAQEITIQAGGQMAVGHYWINRDTLLPVHAELRVSATMWWRDPRFPAKYLGTHDSKNYENWETINFNATFGRVLVVDFELE